MRIRWGHLLEAALPQRIPLALLCRYHTQPGLHWQPSSKGYRFRQHKLGPLVEFGPSRRKAAG